MKTAYSNKTLTEKLGVKSGMQVAIINAPADYFDLLGDLPTDVTASSSLRDGLDFVQGFFTTRRQVSEQLPGIIKRLRKNGMLWISWPKRTSGVTTDLNEQVVRDIGLAAGVVDIKIAAINEVWSGLKFVFRLVNR